MIKYKFCPKCGAKLKNFLDYYKCTSCGYKVFLHSAPTASVLIVRGDKVLLGKRKFEPQKGKTDVIGGFLKFGEEPEAGAKREAKEELGVEIRILDLLGVYMDSYYYQEEDIPTINFIYVAEIPQGRIKEGDDIEKTFWQPIFQKPKNLAFRIVGKALLDLGPWYKMHMR